jgi:hypothetical protein
MKDVQRSVIKSVVINPSSIVFDDLCIGEYFIRGSVLESFISEHGKKPVEFSSIRSHIFMVCDESLVVSLNGIVMDSVSSTRRLIGVAQMNDSDRPLHRVQVSLNLEIN